MANIQNFLEACRAFGLEGHELVAVADVFEMKCTAEVVDCLVSAVYDDHRHPTRQKSV